MARVRAFTDEDVIDAANALLREGKNINGTQLRNRVGSGRPEKLYEVYQKLVADKQINTEDLSAPTVNDVALPAEVLEMKGDVIKLLNTMITNINNQAHRNAEKYFMGIVKEAESTALSAEARMNDMELEMTRAFEQVEDANDALEELNTKYKTVVDELEVSQTALSTATQQIEGMRKDAERMTRNLENVTTELDITNSSLTKERETNQSLKQDAQYRNTEIEALNTALKTATNDFKTQGVTLSETVIERERALELVNQRTDQLTNSEYQLVILNEKNAQQQMALGENKAQLVTATKMIESNVEEIEKLKASLNTSNDAVKAEESKANRAVGATEVLKDEILALKSKEKELYKEIESLKNKIAGYHAQEKNDE
ncbi:DNA-binding protein [Enterovibrio norvegicus]|uniref:DNA-binding protein n=1 Tax=Enterovibrio norvegicus TaxID=188144 RepID=UPI000C85E90A|nr:DNA-binding protein [Enterovibrio norvegicus]PMH64500.1 hypothetical protein BCU62_15715 [Enterovibrio norvegicus]